MKRRQTERNLAQDRLLIHFFISILSLNMLPGPNVRYSPYLKKQQQKKQQYYQLWHIVEDNQVGPCVCWTEIAFIIHSTQLTDPRKTKKQPQQTSIQTVYKKLLYQRIKHSAWGAELTYKAITVVTGLTTVYCNTPNLHLNSKTLQRKCMIWIRN